MSEIPCCITNDSSVPGHAIFHCIAHEWVELENFNRAPGVPPDDSIVVMAAFSPKSLTNRYWLALAGVFRNVYSGETHRRLLKREELMKMEWNGTCWAEKQNKGDSNVG